MRVIVFAFSILLSASLFADAPKGFFLGIEAGPMSQFPDRSFQPYLAINAGYDVLPWLALGVAVGQGFSSSNPPDYSMLALDLGALFSLRTVDWLELCFGLMGGATYLSPTLNYDPSEWGINGRGSIGFRYYTLLAGVSLGADISVMGTYAPKSDRFLVALSLTPQLKYVF